MRLAAAVHAQGYKVVLTGEGADEALAGYAWFKTQKIRERPRTGGSIPLVPTRARSLALASMGGDAATGPTCSAINGRRTAQQDVYDLLARPVAALLRRDVGPPCRPLGLRRSGHHQRPRSALGPAEPVALRRLQGDARRPLAERQGRPRGDELVGRGALSAARRRRDQLLRHDRSGVQAARPDRQVAAPTGGRPDAADPDRQPAQDDVPRQPLRRVPRPGPPAWVDQLLSPESLEATGYFDRQASLRERAAQVRFPGSRPGASSWT